MSGKYQDVIFLFAVAAALGAGAAAAVLVGALPRLARRTKGVPVELPIVLAAFAGLLSRASLTGNLVPDLVLGGGVGALGAWAGARAPHRVLAVSAVVLAVLLGLSPWAAAAAGVAVAVVLLRTRVPPVKAAAGGLLGVGILAEVGQLGPGPREGLALLGVVVLAGIAARRQSDSAGRIFSLSLSAGLLIIIVAAAGFLAFAIPAARDLQRAVDLSEGATEVLATTRSEDAASSLALAANAFAQASQRLDSLPARIVEVVPGAAQNAAALRALAGAGEEVAAAAGAATTGPADLAIRDGAVDLSAIDDAGRSVREARGAVLAAVGDLRAIRSRSLIPPVADASAELHGRLADALPTLHRLERAFEHLPPVLGAGRPRRYLLALQSPSESRGAGGIVGAYGVIEADRGRLTLTRTGNVSDLNVGGNPAGRGVEEAEEFLARYGRFQPLQNWQNVSMSPDWPTVGRVIAQLYPQSGGQPIDGVLGLDPFALSAILEGTGPIEVPPWPTAITADNAAAVLLHEQYLFFPKPERQEFLGDVTEAIFNRLSSGASLRAVAVGLAEAAQQRSVQLWSANEEEQELFAEVAAAGEFPRPNMSSDLLAVVNQNSSGNKIDWFLHRSTNYTLTFDPVLGRVDARLRIELRNEAPASGLPDYVIGSPSGPRASRTAPGENRSWISVYTPLGLTGARMDGAALQMEEGGELGHRVYSAFVLIPPGGTITLELDLVGLVDPFASSYNLLLRSQVLPNPETVSVAAQFTPGWEAQGRTREEFDLRGGERRLTFGFKAAGD